MRTALAAALVVFASPALAENSSVYTDLDFEKNCTQYDTATEGDGADFVCDGYKGFPVLLSAGDLRESLFYGFPPSGDLKWESFGGFNSTGPKIEWRLLPARGNDDPLPFATIHRWFVSDDPDDSEKKTEVLVVEKVGQPQDRSGCVVAYVVAKGNGDANAKARRYADEMARDFACGADQPAIDSGTIPLPDLSVAD